jgi:beta-glucosidase
MILGCYPEEGVELFAADMPDILAGDLECISQKLDYFGANIYSGNHVRATADNGFADVKKNDLPETAMGWPVTPEALYWGPKFFYERYQLPVVVTESGMANDDRVRDGKIYDRERIDFLYSYLSEYARAIKDGVPALGYFLWSLLDNFEWAEGYSKRFGIVYVDYETQQRIPKYSAYWYKALIASHKSGSIEDAVSALENEQLLDLV